MLSTLPYYSYKYYRTIDKLCIIIIDRHAECLISIYLKAANNQYAFKQYTPTILQLFMLLSSNVLLLYSKWAAKRTYKYGVLYTITF